MKSDLYSRLTRLSPNDVRDNTALHGAVILCHEAAARIKELEARLEEEQLSRRDCIPVIQANKDIHKAVELAETMLRKRIAELEAAMADVCNRGAMTDPPGDYALVPLDAMERLEALKRGDE